MKTWTMLSGCLFASLLSSMGEETLEWKARWIWQEEDGPANSRIAFRKGVELDAVPGKVTANIAGICPTKPGWREFEVMPVMAHLNSIKTVVPSVQVDLANGLWRDGKAFGTRMTTPKGTTAVVGIPGASGPLEEVRVDGIELAGEDGEFLRFRVKPGFREFSATSR